LFAYIRQINARTDDDDKLHFGPVKGAKYTNSLDLKDEYCQIPLEAGSRQYTAFTVPGKGLFQWNMMKFGLRSFTYSTSINSKHRLGEYKDKTRSSTTLSKHQISHLLSQYFVGYHPSLWTVKCMGTAMQQRMMPSLAGKTTMCDRS